MATLELNCTHPIWLTFDRSVRWLRWQWLQHDQEEPRNDEHGSCFVPRSFALIIIPDKTRHWYGPWQVHQRVSISYQGSMTLYSKKHIKNISPCLSPFLCLWSLPRISASLITHPERLTTSHVHAPRGLFPHPDNVSCDACPCHACPCISPWRKTATTAAHHILQPRRHQHATLRLVRIYDRFTFSLSLCLSLSWILTSMVCCTVSGCQ